MKIPSATALASSIRCHLGEDTAGQTERDHSIVAQLPGLAFTVPCPTGLLHPLPDWRLGKGDAHTDDPILSEVSGGGSQSRSATTSSPVVNRFFRFAS
jgi:hypothetical protein